MERVKVQSNTARSTKLYVPVDGLVSLDEQGVTEVSAKCAEILTTNTNDWELLDKPARNQDADEVPSTDEEEEE